MNKSTELELICATFMSGYLSRLTTHYPTLHWTEHGAATLASVVGFIAGLEAAGNREAAENHAKDFLSFLSYTCRYHAREFDLGHRKVEVPGRVCRMHSDGTAMGFSLAWYVLLDDQQQQGEKFGTWGAKYTYQMNGGLLYRGFGQEIFSVQIGGGHLWSMHT